MKNLLLSMLCLAVSLTAGATDFTGAAPANGKSYYLYNVASGKFLAPGNNNGVVASMSEVGTDVKLATKDDGFTIATHFGGGYLSRTTEGVLIDQSEATTWLFALVDTAANYYTISNGTIAGYMQTYSSTSNTKVRSAPMPKTPELAYWILVPTTELDKKMDEATYSNPVDATHLIANSCFDVSYNGTNPWQGTTITTGGYTADSQGANGGNYVAYHKDQGFDSYIEISKKAGIYTIVAQGCHYNKADANSIDAQFYIGDSYITLPNATSSILNSSAKSIAKGEYMLEAQTIAAVSRNFSIGFRKEGANTGDLTMIDNLRLYYHGNELEDYQALVVDLNTKAAAFKDSLMAVDAKTAIQTQLDALATTDTTTKFNCNKLANETAAAISAAKRSIKVLDKLNTAIIAADAFLADASGNGIDELKAAVAAAKGIHANAPTDAAALQAITDLQTALNEYNFANASGDTPTVTTDPRFARGGTMAFGRMTVSGVAASEILEQGFCYATHPEPTYSDMRTTEFLSNNGKIFWLKNLTPGTIYYMRPYALTRGYAIGYGDVLKVITIPKGNVNYKMNAGWPDQATEDRVRAACEQSKQLWNDLTSINGYNSTVNYGSGTPTADCSYGGWVRVGPNSSYQRTGTILHEWLHGVGVGTHSTWWNSNLRSNGDRGNWMGERAQEVLRFWHNDDSQTLTGDNTHMWPYGVNGAHEDTGKETLYMGLSLILQGLCEDGLIPTSGFCLPAYTLPVDNDNTKYTITSESPNHGQGTAFLFVNSDGSLTWKAATAETMNDSCAWNITFTPNNAYYQIKNVATGRYITYANSTFTTAARTATTSADNFHVMKGRVDVADGQRGYWLIRPENNSTPPTLTATANGKVSSSAFNISNDAVTQRWIITPTTFPGDEETSIENIPNASEIVSSEYFTLGGTKVAAPQRGINIVRQTYANGTVKVQKVLVK